MKKNYFKFFILFLFIGCIIFAYKQIIHLKTMLNTNEKNDISILKEVNLGSTGYKAISTLYSGGATVDFNTRVSIIKNVDSKIDTPPNIFIGNHSNKIDISYKDNILTIYSNCSKDDILLKKTSFKNIKIIYKHL